MFHRNVALQRDNDIVNIHITHSICLQDITRHHSSYFHEKLNKGALKNKYLSYTL
jgi:hypothetical protein